MTGQFKENKTPKQCLQQNLLNLQPAKFAIFTVKINDQVLQRYWFIKDAFYMDLT